jgi:uncharacterized protein involved in exopolysaccharide biosynthesis
MLVVMTLIGGAAAGVTVFALPSYYRSTAAFQAETPLPTQFGLGLTGLANQINNLGLGGSNNAQLFADLLTTDAVLRRVSRAHFPSRSGATTLDSVYGFEDLAEGRRAYETAEQLRNSIAVNVNVRTGMVRFSVEARSPQLALALADSILAALNESTVLLRQERAAAERKFTADRAAHARIDLAASESTLAAFYQRNRVITSSPALQLEEGRLRRSVDVAQQVYLQLRLQEEQAAVQEVRNTPSITVVDPPLLPVKRSWPKRRLSVLGGLLVGLVIGLARLRIES